MKSVFRHVSSLAFLTFALLLLPAQSFADNYQVLTVCAKYKNTGKEYKVNAQIMSGTELNRRTRSYDYNSFSKYAVIFWAQDQVSIIELDYPGTVSTWGTDGTDQRGYKWELSSSTTYCY